MLNVFRLSSVFPRFLLCSLHRLLIASKRIRPGHGTGYNSWIGTLSRLDFGVSGAGEFTNTATGTVNYPASNNFGTTVTQQPSNTLGALVTVRYIEVTPGRLSSSTTATLAIRRTSQLPSGQVTAISGAPFLSAH